MIHKYLLDEPPLVILPSLATLIGLNEAIVLQQVHYWVANAKEARRMANFQAGRWWVYNSYPEWRKTFPFWSEPTIKRTFLGLEKGGLLLSGLHSNDPRDRSKWYTVDYEALQALIEKTTGSNCAGASDQIDLVRRINLIPSTGSNWRVAPDQPDPMHQIKSARSYKETDTTTKTTTKTTTDPLQPSALSSQSSRQEPTEDVVVAFPASLVEALVTVGVTRAIASRLVTQQGEEAVRRQLEALPFRKCDDRAATLVTAIQETWELPAAARKPRPSKRRLVATNEKASAIPPASETDREVMREALAAARQKTRSL